MPSFVSGVMKVALTGILWVFILSIPVNGKTMFSYSHDILVDNALVRLCHEKFWEAYSQIRTAVSDRLSDKGETRSQRI